jgi:hypothetical protein
MDIPARLMDIPASITRYFIKAGAVAGNFHSRSGPDKMVDPSMGNSPRLNTEGSA